MKHSFLSSLPSFPLPLPLNPLLASLFLTFPPSSPSYSPSHFPLSLLSPLPLPLLLTPLLSPLPLPFPELLHYYILGECSAFLASRIWQCAPIVTTRWLAPLANYLMLSTVSTCSKYLEPIAEIQAGGERAKEKDEVFQNELPWLKGELHTL